MSAQPPNSPKKQRHCVYAAAVPIQAPTAIAAQEMIVTQTAIAIHCPLGGIISSHL